MSSSKTMIRLGAAAVAVPTALLLVAAPALATDGADEVQVSNTETVQAHLDATGKVRDKRIYEQIAMFGKGKVDIANPVSTKNLRNLDGFGGFDVKGGQMRGSFDVDGEQRVRSVSDFTKELPLDVKVTYTLDGKTVPPGDVVGRSGTLAVHYTVENRTARAEDVTYDDGTGHEMTSTEQVVIPMVGQLTTTLPSSFTDVRSDEASMAGDGRGGTKMSFTMTLFGPIGSPTAEFGYTAHVSDGVVPPATVSALPVNPLQSPSFKGGAASYKGGAESGATLTAGATEIDENLLKLRDGASTLLAGLVKLNKGAAELKDGLQDQAAPGARQLAKGAGDLDDGAGTLNQGARDASEGAGKLDAGAKQLDAGVGELDAGAGKLDKGARDAKTGAGQLDAGAQQLKGGLHEAGSKAPALLSGLDQVKGGLTQVDQGLAQLYGGIGQLPEKAKPLHQGIQQLIDGLGDTESPGTLIAGVDQIREGFVEATRAGGKIDQLKSGVDQAKGGVDQVKDGVDQAAGGVDQVKKGLDEALAPGGGIDQLAGGVELAKNADCGLVCKGILAQVGAGITDLRAKTGQASGGLGQVSDGLRTKASPGLTQISDGLGDQISPGVTALKAKLVEATQGLARIECGMDNTTLPVCDSKQPGLRQGLDLVNSGVGQLVNGVVKQVQDGVGTAQDTPADNTLRGGVNGLSDGVDQLHAGGKTLIEGLGQLETGAGQLSDGTGQLSDGLGDLADGTGQLKDGADRLKAGSGQLSDGTGKLYGGLWQLATGTGQLKDGTGRLAKGAGDLSTGLDSAADGSGQLSDGLDKAAKAAPALPKGAEQLSKQGTKKVIASGKETAQDYGMKYAVIEAGAKRAENESMAYGAPENAAGFTAYQLELAGEDGEGSRNLSRGVAALALFGIGGAAAAVRRRFF